MSDQSKKPRELFEPRTLVIRCVTLFSLHESGHLVRVRPLLYHIRYYKYLDFTLTRLEMKQTLLSLKSSGYVYEDKWRYGISNKGKAYIRDCYKDLSENHISETGKRRIEAFARNYKQRKRSGKTRSKPPRDKIRSGLQDL